jgi:hypothetical protein
MKTFLFWLTVVAVIALQFSLCYEALVCRGYPPLSETGHYKKLASTCLFWVPAVLGNRATRLKGLVVMAVFTTAIFSMISINGMVRPSAGHLIGVMGILRFHLPEILANSLLYSPFVFAVMYIPERVFGDLWRAVWLLPSSSKIDSDTGQDTAASATIDLK